MSPAMPYAARREKKKHRNSGLRHVACLCATTMRWPPGFEDCLALALPVVWGLSNSKKQNQSGEEHAWHA
ncbi:hypothetical protein V1279_006929 [Bradyrhizobium sp. AZCC 1610]